MNIRKGKSNQALSLVRVRELFFKDVSSSIKKDSKDLNVDVRRYKVSGLLGIDVSLKGRQGKRDRASVLGWSKGTIKRNNLNLETQSSSHSIYSKKGVVRLKVELLNEVLSSSSKGTYLLNKKSLRKNDGGEGVRGK